MPSSACKKKKTPLGLLGALPRLQPRPAPVSRERGRGAPPGRVPVTRDCGRERALVVVFFFKDPATPEIYPLPPHGALPICWTWARVTSMCHAVIVTSGNAAASSQLDRKSTRLNSSHGYISHALFCLKK